MPGPAPTVRSHVTLGLCTILHAFTHAYGTILVPLYLLIAADLKLGGVKAASLVVTVYGFVYCLVSYIAGVLADRADRRFLLGVGLLGNAAAITLMGVTRRYELLLVLAVVAGLFGALFHPSANALVSAHYPRNPGMAIGMLAVGSGIGFFLGPQYAGWRAEEAHWQLGSATIAAWQRPLLEAGAAGLVFSVLFLLVAREAERRQGSSLARISSDVDFANGNGNANGNGRPDGNGHAAVTRVAEATRPKAVVGALDPLLRRRLFGVSLTLMCRDFAGVASLTLASIYLQKAHGLNTKRTGFIVGSMMLIGVIVNPLCVYLSPGKRRLPALAAVLAGAGVIVLAVPMVSVRWVLPVLCLFQACHLGSYAISEAAMLERVDPAVRGRVIGLFLSVAGTFASTAPWVMGFWTDALGESAKRPLAYLGPFGLVGAFMLLATLSTPIIARLGEPTGQEPIRPMSEATPGTLEPVG
jgi:MFS family permease